MKLILISLFALVSVALAVTREEQNEFIKRQNDISGNVPVNVPAMTDAQGNVILFDANNVYLAAKANGL